MFKTMVNAWKIEDLRNKILFTLFIIFLYRLGNVIPIPMISQQGLQAMFGSFAQSGSTVFLGYLNMLTGGSFQQATIFALSIGPYITASIIVQLLTMAIPSLERMVKEGGEEGKKKQAAITRYATVAIGLIQGFVYYLTLSRYNVIVNNNVWTAIIIIMTFSAGTALVMWLGELITNKGIGNGISMILFAGILSRLPAYVSSAVNYVSNAENLGLAIAIIAIMIPIALVMVGFVVWVSEAERRLPVQYAKRVVGRKVYGGQSSFIPLKVNMTGVMPVIFASSIVSLPAIIASFFTPPAEGTFWYGFLKVTQAPSPLYIVLYIIFIIAFSFFYAYATFNPVEIANNMKSNGGFIPGLRPGRPTADYITRVLKNVTVMGALFLSLVAVLPILASALDSNLGGMALGGTTLLIVVGVALETVRAMESHMLMRHYKGFLD